MPEQVQVAAAFLFIWGTGVWAGWILNNVVRNIKESLRRANEPGNYIRQG